MSVRSLIKSGLVAASLACLFSLGTPTKADAGPAFATQTPSPGQSRAAGALPQNSSVAHPVDPGTPVTAAGAERRIALVIGNSAYENVTVLPNPANDAKAIGKFLNSAGFEVIQATDLDHDEMIQVLQDFSAKVSERGPNTVAFVYYAGHGLQIAGDNYLVPVDAKIGSESDVPNAAIRLVDVMATLQAVPSRMRIVVLDACRNNPFSQLKDTGRGLAIVDAPNGSIVGYSTAPGTEAFDGEGSNSPYTSAFLRVASEPNLPIEQFFKKVRVAVNGVTEGKQTPWESSSLTSDFYFFGDTAVAASKNLNPALSANASASRPTAVASNIRTRTAREAYNYAVAEDSVEYYEEYVRVYPYDPFADRIRRLLAAKLLAAAWHSAVMANSPVAYKAFYSKYTDSPYTSMAMKLESQPKIMPLYQPTKIIVAPQIAPQVKLTNFNGINVPQGKNAPIGLGGNGSLFNKAAVKLQTPSGSLGAAQPQSGPLQPNAAQGGPIQNGQVKQLAPGVDLAKGGRRPEAKIDGGRLTTLPQSNQPSNGTIGQGGSTIKKDVKVMNGNSGIRPPSGPSVVKRVEAPRVVARPLNGAGHQHMSSQPGVVKRVQPAQRVQTNGNADAGRNVQVRTAPKATPFGASNSSGRFAGGGMGFGRSFR